MALGHFLEQSCYEAAQVLIGEVEFDGLDEEERFLETETVLVEMTDHELSLLHIQILYVDPEQSLQPVDLGGLVLIEPQFLRDVLELRSVVLVDVEEEQGDGVVDFELATVEGLGEQSVDPLIEGILQLIGVWQYFAVDEQAVVELSLNRVEVLGFLEVTIDEPADAFGLEVAVRAIPGGYFHLLDRVIVLQSLQPGDEEIANFFQPIALESVVAGGR